MGEHDIKTGHNEEQMRAFTLSVLSDLQAFEYMFDNGHFSDEVCRIGAEQEMFLVDSAMRPTPRSLDVIADAGDPRLTTEIGLFNLEANLSPREFKGDCLSLMENELNELLGIVRNVMTKFGGGVVMAGILPTIQKSDLTVNNLTPHPRYHEIDRIVTELHGENRMIHIKGLDELQLTLQNTYIEFCNTSFQIHLQIAPGDFVRYYNWAQALSAPVLAAAVNSPLLLNHRLWHETRIAVFKQSTDTRSLTHRQRNQKPRVNFGDDWVNNSILEVLREDVVRYRILLTQAVEENSLEVLAAGGVPELKSWRLHNGTIWRWNRPCYGILDGKPGLRIEARYLPAGPTVIDQMANAAFFLGLLTEMPEEFGDIRDFMSFDDARTNFYNAARYGLKGQIRGLDGQSRRIGRIILEELLPRARKGLARANVDEADIGRLLDVIEQRVITERTGAQWMLDSYESMGSNSKPTVKLRTITATMKSHQDNDDIPVHEWDLAEIPEGCEWIDSYRTVEQFMSVDLYTVRPEDIVDLAASLMHWRHVRHVPVEDDSGKLIGLVSHRDLLELIAQGKCSTGQTLVISDVMKTDIISVTPGTSSIDALQLMREKNVGCLPVLDEGRLVGLITTYDFLTVSAKLLEERLNDT
ncbi:MAG: CBS domain-containing protein [Chloracidobacterium sp.]|nr:CBS domain-containing protein [Chloracidobacterium sp.]